MFKQRLRARGGLRRCGWSKTSQAAAWLEARSRGSVTAAATQLQFANHPKHELAHHQSSHGHQLHHHHPPHVRFPERRNHRWSTRFLRSTSAFTPCRSPSRSCGNQARSLASALPVALARRTYTPIPPLCRDSHSYSLEILPSTSHYSLFLAMPRAYDNPQNLRSPTDPIEDDGPGLRHESMQAGSTRGSGNLKLTGGGNGAAVGSTKKKSKIPVSSSGDRRTMDYGC